MKATTKINFNSELQEYRVRLFIDGVYQAGADYFTDDKQDAKDTAEHMQKNASKSDKTTNFAKAEQADFEEEKNTMSKLEAYLKAHGRELVALKPVSGHPGDKHLLRVLWTDLQGKFVIHLWNGDTCGLSGGHYHRSIGEALTVFNSL